MHPIYQLVFAIWILASLGDNIRDPALDSVQRGSIKAKYYNSESVRSYKGTSAKLRDKDENKSKNMDNGANLLENPSTQPSNIVSGNHHGVALSYEELLNNTTYNAQDGIFVTRLKRAARSNSGKSINPKRHEKQKKSNHITPRKNKLDIVKAKNKKPRRDKSQKKQKQFDIQLPFPNFESEEEEQFDEYNVTMNDTNESASLSEDHSSIGINTNENGGQFVINVDDYNKKNSKGSRTRKAKRRRLNKKVRVPLPYNSAPSTLSEQRKKDALKREKKVAEPTVSYRRHRKQKRRRLPPLH